MGGVTLTEFLLARIAEREENAERYVTLLPSGDIAPLMRWVLAECEAKRRIIAEHEHDLSGTYDDEPGCWCCHQDRDYGLIPQGWCLTLRALALPYADHADYRDEWRV